MTPDEREKFGELKADVRSTLHIIERLDAQDRERRDKLDFLAAQQVHANADIATQIAALRIDVKALIARIEDLEGIVKPRSTQERIIREGGPWAAAGGIALLVANEVLKRIP